MNMMIKKINIFFCQNQLFNEQITNGQLLFLDNDRQWPFWPPCNPKNKNDGQWPDVPNSLTATKEGPPIIWRGEIDPVGV